MTSERTRPATPVRTRGVEADRALLEQLRQMAVHQETASVLEMRAARAPSDPLARVLGERAQEHRRRAERIRAELAGRGITRTPASRPT
ncbi:hypothetical protein GB931_03895 [Modestobacter sp. I12A-02628]|uniref:Uncharacterized protein n=1 Tax=Goekera deserti TaxID=2497753 RepID=A0A7K3WIN1_9ACTN|nr:hypothetical protein [Goekera deserti]MPQ97081.1 hypothetical protein [Goekera deserti]NDI46602.1 hypothetical protein [Goekera deserti]NEL56358.1 hypothetical protein [Goekera deserti]